MRGIGLLLLLVLIALWYTAGPEVEDAMAALAVGLHDAATSVVGGSADRLFDYLTHANPQSTVARYLGYWVAVALSIVLIASVLGELVLHLLVWIPSWASVRVSSRYHRGEVLASRLVPDTHLPRSALVERAVPSGAAARPICQRAG